MTISPATEIASPVQPFRPPTYFPGNDEDPDSAAPAPSADFSFSDFLDVINPLQHIPVISTIYRAITGDTISTPAKVMGGALFGGPIGALAAGATRMVSEMTGTNPETELVAMITGDESRAVMEDDAARPVAPAVQVAAAEPPVSSDGIPDEGSSDEISKAGLPGEAENVPAQSALFAALQEPRVGGAQSHEGGGSRATGRGIRSYIAEAIPNGARPAAPVQSEAGPAEDAERQVAREAVAAVHARGIEMLRQGTEIGTDRTATDIPAWFPDLMMQGLARYRETNQLRAGTSAVGGFTG